MWLHKQLPDPIPAFDVLCLYPEVGHFSFEPPLANLTFQICNRHNGSSSLPAVVCNALTSPHLKAHRGSSRSPWLLFLCGSSLTPKETLSFPRPLGHGRISPRPPFPASVVTTSQPASVPPVPVPANPSFSLAPDSSRCNADVTCHFPLPLRLRSGARPCLPNPCNLHSRYS